MVFDYAFLDFFFCHWVVLFSLKGDCGSRRTWSMDRKVSGLIPAQCSLQVEVSHSYCVVRWECV